MEKTRFRGLCIAAALTVAGLFFWIRQSWGGDQLTLAAVDVVNFVAPLVAAWACFRKARVESGRTATGWRLLAFGCLAWGLGQGYVTYWEIWVQRNVPIADRKIPFPSVADIGFLSFIPLGAAGIALLPRAVFRNRVRAKAVLDAGLLAVSILSVIWWLVLRDYDSGSTTKLGTWLLLAYPWGDVVLVATALTMWNFVAREDRQGLLVLLVGILTFTAADVGYLLEVQSDYLGTSEINVLWPAGFLLMAVSALRPNPGQAGNLFQVNRPRLLLPAVIIFATVLGAAANLQHTDDSVQRGLVVLVCLGVAARWAMDGIERRRVQRIRHDLQD